MEYKSSLSVTETKTYSKGYSININSENQRVFPAFSKNNIAICLSSSDFYAPYCGVLIYSIICHSNLDNNYDIIILERDIQEKNKDRILEMIKNYENISIRFLNMSKLGELLSIKPRGHFSLEGSFKLFLMSEIFVNYLKLIVLDSDLVLEKDIAELFGENIDNYYMAATDDVIMKFLISHNRFTTGLLTNIPASEYISDYLGYGSSDIYLNTGVILMNLERCRRDNLYPKAMQLANTRKYWFLEQDVLNELIGKNTKLLSLKWNLLADNNYGEIISSLKDRIKDEYIDGINDAYIVHFAGEKKPWLNPSLFLADKFYKYARSTPFYEIIQFNLINATALQISQKEIQANAIREVKKPCHPKDKKSRNLFKYIVPSGSKRQLLFNKLCPNKSLRKEFLRESIKKLLREPNRLKDCTYFMGEKLKKYYLPLISSIPGTYKFRNKHNILKLKNSHEGERCFFIGLGPSLKISDLNQLDRECTFAVNSVFKLFEQTTWRPTYYLNQEFIVPDREYRWKKFIEMADKYQKIPNMFFPLCPISKKIMAKYPDAITLPIADDWCRYSISPMRHFSLDCSRIINAAYLSMYSAMQLAVYMGFKEIYLIGVDANYTSVQPHCYDRDEMDKRYFSTQIKADTNTQGINRGFEAMKNALEILPEVRIYNATRGGSLELFPRVNFDDLMMDNEREKQL